MTEPVPELSFDPLSGPAPIRERRPPARRIDLWYRTSGGARSKAEERGTGTSFRCPAGVHGGGWAVSGPVGQLAALVLTSPLTPLGKKPPEVAALFVR